ncbi:ADP-ribosylation factor-binding protein GGA2-like isoform X2 [Boleophthalmus pectinirostris]|uniref:ADP-ribosylation factor-binding protein GGA2-like isoform X2 n=1 Tax=Boleophthalmus pectinirostris TaxID=150288 RepID=UPI002432FBA2|nr:ADP-ribosylation factor-binding protein GGA2-like isoform X2 [Boleophthalmus pectinirostris]
MASADSPASLETLLNQATDPQHPEERWEGIQAFYQTVKQQPDGPQVALRLLAHKIQSPQEREALKALTVLEACMNECGQKFHCEVAKFRFLNELIKVLSPKYYGAWSPEKVKERLVEVLYGWTLWLRDQPKIQEAYDMLKKQDIVKKDPKLSSTLIMPPAPNRSSASIFDQDDTTKLLDRLLKSGRPEDLETANRLIKSAMQAEQERAAKVKRREDLLKEAHSTSRQLQEMLEREAQSKKPSQDIQGVFERCDRLRPTLFRLASETAEDDVALSQVLEANDELTLAIKAYRAHVSTPSEAAEGKTVHRSPVSSPREVKSYHLIDLSSLDPELRPNSPVRGEEPQRSPVQGEGSGPVRGHTEGLVPSECPSQKASYLEELIQLDDVLDSDESWEGRSQSEPTTNGTQHWSQSHSRPYLELETSMFSEKSSSPVRTEEPSLQNVFVPVHSIRASHLEPVPVLDRAGVHVSLHFSRDPPVGRPSVAVLVLSTVNTSALRVSSFCFQAAVPKVNTVSKPFKHFCRKGLGPHAPVQAPVSGIEYQVSGIRYGDRNHIRSTKMHSAICWG